MFKGETATRLADLLEVAAKEPQYTGGLSMLDEATAPFGRFSSEIGAAHRRFAEARLNHLHRHRALNPEALEGEVVGAARELAALLRPLGGVQISYCKRPSPFGECPIPLDPDGVCRSSFGHTDGGA